MSNSDSAAQLLTAAVAGTMFEATQQISRTGPYSTWQAGPATTSGTEYTIIAFSPKPSHVIEPGTLQGVPDTDFDTWFGDFWTLAGEADYNSATYSVYYSDYGYAANNYFEWPLTAGSAIVSYTLEAGTDEVTLVGSDGSRSTVTVPGAAPPYSPFTAYLMRYGITPTTSVYAHANESRADILTAFSAATTNVVSAQSLRSGNGGEEVIFPEIDDPSGVSCSGQNGCVLEFILIPDTQSAPDSAMRQGAFGGGAPFARDDYNQNSDTGTITILGAEYDIYYRAGPGSFGGDTDAVIILTWNP